MQVGNLWTYFWDILIQIFQNVISLFRRCTFYILSMGSIPNHIAFILDGNRRYAKKKNLSAGAGHRFGYYALTSMIRYCFEMGVKYVTIYAFSIDNFNRRPDEIQVVMDLMLDKIQLLIREECLINQYGMRVHFVGNISLLSEPLRTAIERAMAATKNNNRTFLSICVAYTSTEEIVHAVEKSCEEKWDSVAGNGETESSSITLADVEKHMYLAVTPDLDLLVRTSGEARLSNFLLWQTYCSYLYSPSALWPEINFWHLLWGVLNFQRNYLHLVKQRKNSYNLVRE